MPTPDFICQQTAPHTVQAVFEIKEFRTSGTTRIHGPVVSQRVTTQFTLKRFLIDATQKFNNHSFAGLPSGLVLTNLRPYRLWPSFFNEVSTYLAGDFSNWAEVGTLIIAGYNQPSNQIIALHILDNAASGRRVPRGFFASTNHTYYLPGQRI